jgi:hypothetical protein
MADYYAPFAYPDFDSNEYANATLAGDPYPYPSPTTTSKSSLLKPQPVAKEDISVAISKLNFGIEDVAKQIKSVVRSFCVV